MSETETAKIEDRKGFEALVLRLARDSWDDARTAAELLAVLDSGCEMALANLERRSAELTASLSREAALVAALELALSRVAHRASCYSVRPTSEWPEHGSVSFANCDCEIRTIRAALNPTTAA